LGCAGLVGFGVHERDVGWRIVEGLVVRSGVSANYGKPVKMLRLNFFDGLDGVGRGFRGGPGPAGRW
jgi:hypothetical protein